MRTQASCSYRWIFWSLALLGFALDQGSKYAVFTWLYNAGHGGYYPLFQGPTARLVPWGEGGGQATYEGYSPNSDAAFGLRAEFTRFTDPGDGLLSPLRTWGGDYLPHVNKGALFGVGNVSDLNTAFLVISLAAALTIIGWSVRGPLHDRGLCLSLGLILAGTLGNLYDRIVFSGVRDFLHWNYLFNWPVFNLADCCLVCGAGLLLVQALAHHPQPTDSAAASQGQPAQPTDGAGNGHVSDASAPGSCGVI